MVLQFNSRAQCGVSVSELVVHAVKEEREGLAVSVKHQSL